MTTTRAFTDEDSVYAEGLLQSVPLFRNMPHEALIDLSSRLRWIKWPAGRDIFHVDADGATLYIILSGAVKVFIPALDGREVVLAVLRKSDLLGEMSLLDGEPALRLGDDGGTDRDGQPKQRGVLVGVGAAS